MDQNQLLSATVELGLDLLEKNGTFTPFCKAATNAGESMVYTAASDTGFSPDEAYESVLFNVKNDLEKRNLVGAAFCFHSKVRIGTSEEKKPAIEVEMHYQGAPAAIWYFLYRMDGKKASVMEYYKNDAVDDLFA